MIRLSTVPRRTLYGVAAIVLVLLLGGGYVTWRGLSATAATDTDGFDLGGNGIVYVDTDGRTRLADTDGETLGTGPRCERAAAAAGRLACLHALNQQFSSEITVYDGKLNERVKLPLWGIPSRTRLSADGRFVAWTVFREGDSYMNNGQFSTTAGIYDLKTKDHYGSLEDFTAVVDGERFERENLNYWGVTFTDDDHTFYATMASGDTTWLIRGDLRDKSLTALRENVECPSLSPDGTRVAYKHRDGDRWRLHVLNLKSGKDIALAETAHVDDQAAWLDDETVAYAKSHDDAPAVFTVAADGGGEPYRLLAGSSPTAIGDV